MTGKYPQLGWRILHAFDDKVVIETVCIGGDYLTPIIAFNVVVIPNVGRGDFRTTVRIGNDHGIAAFDKIGNGLGCLARR